MVKWDKWIVDQRKAAMASWIDFAITALQTFGAQSKVIMIALVAFETAVNVARAISYGLTAAAQVMADPSKITLEQKMAAAATVMAWTYANAAAIAAAGIVKGVGIAMSPGASGGGGGMPATVESPVGPAVATAETGILSPREQVGTVNIIIEGDVLADEYYLEMLAEKISEYVEDREVRILASGTRRR